MQIGADCMEQCVEPEGLLLGNGRLQNYLPVTIFKVIWSCLALVNCISSLIHMKNSLCFVFLQYCH